MPLPIDERPEEVGIYFAAAQLGGTVLNIREGS